MIIKAFFNYNIWFFGALSSFAPQGGATEYKYNGSPEAKLRLLRGKYTRQRSIKYYTGCSIMVVHKAGGLVAGVRFPAARQH